jgi:hypothetical protein
VLEIVEFAPASHRGILLGRIARRYRGRLLLL